MMPSEIVWVVAGLLAIAAGVLLLDLYALRVELAEARQEIDRMVLESWKIFEDGRLEGVAQADACWRAHPLYQLGYRAGETAAQARAEYGLETCRDVERGEGVE